MLDRGHALFLLRERGPDEVIVIGQHHILPHALGHVVDHLPVLIHAYQPVLFLIIGQELDWVQVPAADDALNRVRTHAYEHLIERLQYLVHDPFQVHVVKIKYMHQLNCWTKINGFSLWKNQSQNRPNGVKTIRSVVNVVTPITYL